MAQSSGGGFFGFGADYFPFLIFLILILLVLGSTNVYGGY